MAKQIKSPIPDSIFDKAVAGAKALLEVVKDIIGEFKAVGEAAKKAIKEIDFKKAEGAKELTDQIKKLEEQTESLQKVTKKGIEVEKDLEKIRKEETKVKKQLAGLTDEAVKGKIKFNAANKAQRDELKALIVIEDKQAGTLAKLKAANAILRLEREKLNADLPEQAQRLKEINEEIDKNNERNDELSDKQKKARQNVGNYTESINEALASSEAFTSATSDLAGIQGVLAGVMKVVTAALRKNEDQTKDNERATGKMGRTSQRVGRVLKTALVGALVAAGAAVGAFVTKTQEGQIALETLTKQALGTSNVVLGRLIELGKGLVAFGGLGFSGVALAFKEAFRPGLADDIRNVNTAVSELVKTQFQAANAARAVSSEIERRLKLEEELREVADDDTIGFRERQKAAAELTRIFLTGNSALSQQSNLLRDQLEIVRERVLIAVQERVGDKIDTEALRAQITASRELSEVILSNKQLLGENNALIIDTTVLDELIEAEKAFLQKETELNSQRLTDRQKIAKLLFDEVEQEVDFLIDANAQIVTSNQKVTDSEKETFETRRRALDDSIQLIKEANKAVTEELAKTAEGVEGTDIVQAFSDALDVSDLNRKLKDLGLAEIPINRLLELFKEIKIQERDFKEAGQILDEAITGGGEAGERIKILKQSNAEIAILAGRITELGRVDVSALSSEKLKEFGERLEEANEDLDQAREERARKLLELEIKQLEARLNLAKAGSAEFLSVEEELLGKKLDLISAEEAAALDAIDKEDKARDEAAKKEDERQKKAEKQRADAISFLENALSANANKRQESLDKQIDNAKARQDEIQQAIIAGNEGASESLNKARREEEEAARAREQLLEKQKQREATLTMLRLLSTYASAGVQNPVGRASQDLLAANAFAEAFFYRGAERVDQDGQLKKARGGRDGYRIAVDGSERVLTGKQNTKIGNLSNDILAEVGYLYRSGELVKKGASGGSTASVEELRQINKNLKSLPGKMPVSHVEKDLIAGIITEVVKYGSHTRKIRQSWGA